MAFGSLSLRRVRLLAVIGLVAASGFAWGDSRGFSLDCRQKGRRFVQDGESMMLVLRSNACHFWMWVAENAAHYFTERSRVLDFVGLVAGDPHHENFRHIVLNGRRELVLSDMDDIGDGPFFIDFLKFLSVARAGVESESALSSVECLHAYLDGLQGAKWNRPIPDLAIEDRNKSVGDRWNDYQDRVKGMRDDGEFKSMPGLTNWGDLSPKTQNNFLEFETAIKAALPEGYEIRDRALYVKTTGGSTGVPRFWFYLKKESGDKTVGRHLIEFKTADDPAVGQYQRQRPYASRIADGIRYFWNGGLPENFGIARAKACSFWMRPKLANYLKVSGLDLATAKDAGKFADLTYYLMYHLGQFHGRQPGAAKYAKYLSTHADEALEEGISLVRDYTKEAVRRVGKR